MSKADDFARTLMNRNGGGQPMAPGGDPATAVVRALEPSVDREPEDKPAPFVAPVVDDDTTLPVEQLQRGRYQPRSEIDPATLTELADSIRAQGIVQPIVVRPIDVGRYEIVAGERRWRAAQLAGLSAVPVVIRELDDLAAMVFALVENIQREELNPMEEAAALRTLAEHTTESTGSAPTQRVLADMVGKSVPWVSKRLALLARPESVQQAVVSGAVTVDEAARRSGSDNSQPPRATRKPDPRPTARVDAQILQSSVKRLNTLADSLGLPGVDLPGKPARKDYVAAFELRIMEILDAAHCSIKPE